MTNTDIEEKWSNEEPLPYVSIIVPVYNGENVIKECIESLLALDYPKERMQIIIVDNNSKDSTAEIIKNYPVTYFLEDKVQSSYAARNRGINYSKGEIMAFTDADCIVQNKWLTKAMKGFRDENVGCVAGGIEGYAPSNDVERYLCDNKALAQECTLKHPFLPYPQTANALYRKEVFKKIGLFEDTWISAGDADLAWRMLKETEYKIKYIPEAKILHKHRSSAKALYNQRKTWGYGSVLLYSKYHKEMEKKTFRQFYWDYCNIIRMVFRLLSLIILQKKYPESKKAKYDLISLVGKKVGMIKCCIVKKCFYL